jgi:hypothetical protein
LPERCKALGKVRLEEVLRLDVSLFDVYGSIVLLTFGELFDMIGMVDWRCG